MRRLGRINSTLAHMCVCTVCVNVILLKMRTGLNFISPVSHFLVQQQWVFVCTVYVFRLGLHSPS